MRRVQEIMRRPEAEAYNLDFRSDEFRDEMVIVHSDTARPASAPRFLGRRDTENPDPYVRLYRRGRGAWYQPMTNLHQLFKKGIDVTDYRDPKVTTPKDSSGNTAKWAGVALALLLALLLVWWFWPRDEPEVESVPVVPEAIVAPPTSEPVPAEPVSETPLPAESAPEAPPPAEPVPAAPPPAEPVPAVPPPAEPGPAVLPPAGPAPPPRQ